MKLEDFNFELPRELIAQNPLPRGESRLLHMDCNGSMMDRQFSDIIELVNTGDVLVMNDTKVLPSLLAGRIDDKDISITIVKQISEKRWQVFARPSRYLLPGKKITFPGGDLYAYVNFKDPVNNYIEIDFELEKYELIQKLNIIGGMPLPPYIKRKEIIKEDKVTYQTIYAKHEGSFAAPTAGLHFSDSIINALKLKGVELVFVTLHVGLGTFLAVKSENIEDHYMHEEEFYCSENTASIIAEAKRNKRKIIAVGSTAARVLETMMQMYGKIQRCEGRTSIFIKPGYKFKIVDSMITNFHLPKSTLFMLIAALCGLDRIKHAYNHAILNQYRFFSYGDACFLEGGL